MVQIQQGLFFKFYLALVPLQNRSVHTVREDNASKNHGGTMVKNQRLQSKGSRFKSNNYIPLSFTWLLYLYRIVQSRVCKRTVTSMNHGGTMVKKNG